MPDNEEDSEAVPEKNHIRSPGRRTDYSRLLLTSLYNIGPSKMWAPKLKQMMGEGLVSDRNILEK